MAMPSIAQPSPLPNALALAAILLTFLSNNTVMSSSAENTLAIATRLHLGHASHPPPPARLYDTLTSFARLASTVGADHAVVAVDAEEKIEGYDLVEEVSKICQNINCGDSSELNNEMNGGPASSATAAAPLHPPLLHVLPVTPWGKFVPALNAIVAWCARKHARYCLMASAEVHLTLEVMEVLKSKMDVDRTLVVGVALQGHEYRTRPDHEEMVEVELTGRTSPWNTCCLWNVPKLALTGFLLVSEGLHREDDGTEGPSGVEEVCTIATLQKLLGHEHAQAKLISMPGTSWGQDFGNDDKRREWHERKMMSKFTRARKQMELMGLGGGTVIHC